MLSQQEHAATGRAAGQRVELSEEDYDGDVEIHQSAYGVAGETKENGLPFFIKATGGQSPLDTSSLPVTLEDSIAVQTELRPSDRASTADEMRDQVASLTDLAGGGKFEVRSRHSSANSAKSQPSLTPASPARQLVRHHSSHAKAGRKISGLNTEHELTRFDSRAQANRRGRVRRGRYKSVYLDEGEQHRVWLPRLQTEAELPQPSIARSHPSLNQSFSMTDIQERQMGQQVTSPDPVKNLVANRKRLESRVKAAQEIGRQVSGERWSCTGETTHTPSCKQACAYTYARTSIRTYTEACTSMYVYLTKCHKILFSITNPCINPPLSSLNPPRFSNPSPLVSPSTLSL